MDHWGYLCLVFVILSRLFIAALWSPEEKVLTSWLLFVMFIVILLLSHLVWYLIVSIPDPCCLSYLTCVGFALCVGINVSIKVCSTEEVLEHIGICRHFHEHALCNASVLLILNSFEHNSHMSLLWRWIARVYS